MRKTKLLSRSLISLVCFAQFVFNFSKVEAQTERIFFDKFGIEEGLPEELVFDMVQDQQGFIWATTQNGLVRYDGYTLKVFRSDRSNPEKLWLHNLNGGLILSRNGQLWIGGVNSGGGVSSFNPQTGKFTNYVVDKNDSTKIPFDDCYLLFEDLYGHIWFSSRESEMKGVYCRLDPATGKVHRYFYNVVWGGFNTFMMDIQIAESIQDSSIWLLADGDLLKYNRSNDRFNVVHKNKSNLPGTTGYDSLMELTPPRSSGLIPVRGLNQMHLWDPVNQVVVSSYDYVNPKNKMQVVFEDEGGNFWITSGAYLTRIDHQNKVTEYFEVGKGVLTTDQEINAGAIQLLLPEYQDSNYLWFRYNGSQTGFFRYEYRTKRFQHFNNKFNTETNTPIINSSTSTHFLKDRTGLLWIGTRLNFYKQNVKKEQLINYHRQAGNPKSLPSDTVICLLKDSENKLWVGTLNGLAVLQNEMGEFNVYKHHDKQSNSLSNNVIGKLFEDSANNIWVATNNGINKWNRATGLFQRMLVFDPGNEGIAITEDKQGRIWASVLNKGVYIFAKTGKLLKSYFQDEQRIAIIAIYHDSRGNTWLGDGNYGKGIYRFTDFNKALVQYKRIEGDETSPHDTRARFFIEDDQHNLWIGCDGPLLRYNYEADNFTRYSHPAKASSFTNYAFDQSGNIWFSTYASGGLISVNPATGDITAYGEEQGLLHNDIRARHLVTDTTGRIWLPTQRGLSAFDPYTKTFTNYTERDGYKPGRLFVSAASRNNEIWFGTFYGLYKINPELKKDTTPPQVHITGMSIMDSVYTQLDGTIFKKSVMFTSNIELHHWQKDIGFDFVALHYLRPEDNQYSYMLENYDKNWSAASKERHTTYTNLSPGTYIFKVKGSNADGIWNETGASITIVILPPWWQTWWAYVTYGLFFLAVVWRAHLFQKERTIRKEREKSKERELAKAKEIDQLKTSFFTNISHEFRTPLTLIKGPVQDMLEQYKQDPKLRDRLKLIERNSDHLLKLINQLLDLAKLESGNMTIEKSKGDINSFINAIVSSFYSLAEQKHITIQVDLPPVHYEVLFDKDKLETILINLTNNAIKFTPSGGSVIVSANINPETQSLNLRVKDTGIGIPYEHRSRIFERFHKISETHKEVGTGIGLALVKEIVNLLQGTITVNSEHGEGSEFIAIIPIENIGIIQQTPESDGEKIIFTPSKIENGQPSIHHQLDNNSLKPQILIVEDHNDLRAFIIEILGDEFFFFQAENGKIGLDIAIQEIPDLIISDVMMPEMDGITMAGKLKSDIHTSHIPLILLTAKSTEGSKLKGLEKGADDYLTKPFNKQELLLKVRNAIHRQIKVREKLRAELMSTVPKMEILSADEKFMSHVKNEILKRLSDEQFSVEVLAEEIGLSRSQLYRKVIALTGLSVNELIRKLRMQKASQLLAQKWGPIAQVAYEVGISNLSYFSKVFKEEFGVLPSEYHEKLHSQPNTTNVS